MKGASLQLIQEIGISFLDIRRTPSYIAYDFKQRFLKWTGI